jgi:hypothetical protein
MARTELFSRSQPGGVFTIANWRNLPNEGWFVDSTAGTDADGFGYNPDAPFDSIDYAIGKAAQGDKIYVAPWHVENITTATAINADVAGVTIEGVRMGYLMPTITATAAAGALTVGAANVTLRNLRFVAGFATGVTQGIAIAAAGDGCTLDGLEFRDTTTNLEYLVHINVATTVDNLTIRNCSLVGLTGGSMTNSILFAGTSTNALIEDNYIFVDSSDDVIDHLAAASVNLVVRRNVIINADTDAAGYCLRYKSDGTGAAYHNLMAYNKVDAEVSIGAAAWWFENYASNTIAESGRLDPTTAHAIP